MTAHVLYKKLAPLLRPLSLPYALLMAGRRKLYTRGLFPVFTPPCPCVAIGNAAWGGTGKTPFAAWLLAWARQRGLKAVVLTRGYGGNPGAAPLLVQAGTRPEQSGDEALMLAQAFPEASVLAFPERSRSALYAQRTLNPDLFILDDGMQHLSMGRHADIVLLRPEDLEDEWNRVIPAGSWREGASALASASAFAVKADAETFARLVPSAEKRLSAFGKGFFSFSLCPSGLRPLFMETEAQNTADTQRELAPHRAVGLIAEAADRQTPAPALLDKEQYYARPYILMSGVGNPAQVQDSAVRLMGRPPAQRLDFADHHPYSSEDVLAVTQLAHGALPVLCTSKDAVKLRQFRRQWGCTPVWVMETQLRFGPCLFSETSFPQWWENWWQTQCCRQSAPTTHSMQTDSLPSKAQVL